MAAARNLIEWVSGRTFGVVQKVRFLGNTGHVNFERFAYDSTDSHPEKVLHVHEPRPNMSIESLPVFTDPAAKLWANIPAETRKLLLSNVWCGKCRHSVTIRNFTGAVKAGDLLLVGECSECRSDVARVVETQL